MISQQLCNWPIGYSVSGLTGALFTTKESAVRLFSSCLVLIPYCNINVVVCNRAGWDKNQTDFKRKGELQAVYRNHFFPYIPHFSNCSSQILIFFNFRIFLFSHPPILWNCHIYNSTALVSLVNDHQIRSSGPNFMTTCLDTEVPQKFVIVTLGHNFWDMHGHATYHSAKTNTFLPNPNGSR